MPKYTVFRMDLTTGDTKLIKHTATEEEARRQCASFQRLLKRMEASKAMDDWRYFYEQS